MKNKIKQIAMMAILIALSFVLSYVDSLIVLPFGIPGIKLGIANIAIIYTLYKIGAKEAIVVSILRLVLSSILFGSVLTFLYSLVGAVLSLSLMIILKKYTNLALITISISGAVLHNIGQIIVAVIVMATKEIVFYLPILIITGILSGIGVGILSVLTIKYTKNLQY
ncbi:MAG: Gx transporter family protein [Bacilli bacterium]|jgi:heptaprenyl diphosphate synthase component I|nr:Gx transporter family protein [Staphylococcus sp.]